MRGAQRLVLHEARVFGSLALWVGRRRQGVGDGREFGYARGQGATLLGLAFVCVVETVGVSAMLRDWPAAHDAMLVLDIYTVLLVLGLHAAGVVRPHVLTGDSLRVRYGVRVDVRIPLDAVGAVRRETRMTHERAEGELDLPVGSQTTVTVELDRPVHYFTPLGRRKDVRVVRLYADEPAALVGALKRG
ncbi:hypothetical protein [Streptomyces malaysiense]|uniref:Uncharacterized protein n=1 Tax=Streptomyces malaysiense TaxID=1428626 RepID=A0A1J4Q0Q7_9ACTN|nr:hypothetical protein [Streptomyces malaysiense]OIK26731.1 hypothetical protein VT52_014660 [Streptomyces malaysiense]